MKTSLHSTLIRTVCILQLVMASVSLAQPEGRKDMFPLAVGNEWTFLHQSEFGQQLGDYAQFDSGSTTFTIAGSVPSADSTRWLVRQTRSLIRHFSMSLQGDSTIHDTLNFEIVELNRNLHPMFRMGTFETLWDSELPLFGNVAESTMVHRYYPSDSSNAVSYSFSLVDTTLHRAWATFSYDLKKDTGLIAVQLHYFLLGKVYSTDHRLVTSVVTGVDAQSTSAIPSRFSLSQNYPNPFNPTTTIRYELPHAANVKLRIYDILGREVLTVVDERRPAGVNTIQFNASTLSSGVYFAELRADGYVQVRKMTLVR